MGIVSKPLPQPSFDDTLDSLRDMSDDVTKGLEDMEEVIDAEPDVAAIAVARDKVEDALSTLYAMRDQVEYLKEERLRMLDQEAA